MPNVKIKLIKGKNKSKKNLELKNSLQEIIHKIGDELNTSERGSEMHTLRKMKMQQKNKTALSKKLCDDKKDARDVVITLFGL
jgi:hypothetical protein